MAMTDVEALKAALKHVEALAAAADTQRAVGTKGLERINVVCQAARGWLAHHETTNSGVTLWSDPCWCNGDQTTGGHRHGSGTGTAQAHHEITDEMRMSEPKLSEHVIAHKAQTAGRVTVHGFRGARYREDDFRAMADCGRSTENDKSWMWLEFQTLNPAKVRLCKLCWADR